MISFAQAGEAFVLVERLTAVGVAVSCLEMLFFPSPLRADGLMGWEVSRLRSRHYLRPSIEGWLNLVFSYRATLVAVALRLAAAAALAAGLVDGRAATASVALVAILGVAFSLRCPYGLDGADQLSTLTFCGLTVAHAAGGELSRCLFLWWLALHVGIAYLTSGLAKLASRTWRSGAAIPGVFGTVMYGIPALGAWLKRRAGLCRASAHGVIGGEIALPLCLVAPLPMAWGLLASGALFHLAAAFTMGLNSFLWAFVATYPALLYVRAAICHALAS